MRVLLLAATLCVAPEPAASQSSNWGSVHQTASWYGAFVDHAITNKTAFWFDGQWRRVGAGASPQQLLLRPGLQRTLASGVRVAAGYAYIASAPYGERPASAPLREHRTWQQLTLGHRAGPLAVTHRYRWEQRWLASVLHDGNGGRSTGAWGYQQRARYMVRAQGNLPGMRVGDRALLGFGWNEVLLPVGHGDASTRITQNRTALGVGLPLDGRQRIEVSYLNLWNALSAARTNEFNHTFSVSWVWASAK